MSSRSSPISPRKMIAILWTSMLALLCLVPVVQAESLQSGVYVIDKPGPSGQGGRQLYLAVKGSDITGYSSYALSRQYDASLPDPTCRFFLSGTLSNKSKVDLKTWYVADTGNKLVDGDSFSLTASDAGHWVVHISDDATFANCDISTLIDGDAMSLKKLQPWAVIAAVTSDRSYFYSEPDNGHRGRAYIVRGNAMAVSKDSDAWVFGTYLDTVKDSMSGWVHRETLMYSH